jgi:hypothetical protein
MPRAGSRRRTSGGAASSTASASLLLLLAHGVPRSAQQTAPSAARCNFVATLELLEVDRQSTSAVTLAAVRDCATVVRAAGLSSPFTIKASCDAAGGGAAATPPTCGFSELLTCLGADVGGAAAAAQHSLVGGGCSTARRDTLLAECLRMRDGVCDARNATATPGGNVSTTAPPPQSPTHPATVPQPSPPRPPVINASDGTTFNCTAGVVHLQLSVNRTLYTLSALDGPGEPPATHHELVAARQPARPAHSLHSTQPLWRVCL